MKSIEKKLIIVKNREGLDYIYMYIAGVGYYPVLLIHTAEFDCKYFCLQQKSRLTWCFSLSYHNLMASAPYSYSGL